MNTDNTTQQEYEYMVCVHCTTFNHEKYIRNCLDGFVIQKTTFPFIVVVVDDASTDRTSAIISEYATLYPNIIRPVLLEENHYSINKPKTPYFEPFDKKSKYIAFCEGDDYWTDPEKLQKQVDALEKHPDCKVCVHKVEKLYEKGGNRKEYLPSFNLNTGRIKSKQFIKMFCEDYPFQTNSYLVSAAEYLEYVSADLNFRKVAKSGDFPLMLYFGQLANAYYINEILSCYRVGGTGSHNDRMASSKEYRETVFSSIDNMIKEFDKYTNFKYHKFCLLNIQRYKYNRVVIAHNSGDITTEQYEKEIVKRKYRYFFRENTPFKSRMLTYLNVYMPGVGKFVKQHFVHSK